MNDRVCERSWLGIRERRPKAMSALFRLLAVITALACGGCGLTVSRHSTSNLTDADANAIFARSWQILNNRDFPGDIQCDVSKLSLSSSGRQVKVFTTGDGAINSQGDFNA